MTDTSQMWHCNNCGLMLARIEQDDNGPRLVFDSAMLPSLIRNAPGFIDVECPRCGTIRKWHKTLDLSAES
jgi:phage FluMu protein Com